MLSLRPPSDAAIHELLRVHCAADLSYPEAGATRGELPAGYHIDRRTDVIGPADAFDRARSAIARWEMHLDAGVRVVPSSLLRPGVTVALITRALGLWTVSLCRIIYCIDEVDAFGFAYGTLADHPVTGEERFLLTRTSDHITLELTAFSRPRSLMFKLASPLARRAQLAIGARYVEALRRCVTAGR